MSTQLDQEDAKDATIIDETNTNLLVQRPDGEVEVVTLSPMNSLLFKHNLWGLLREGDTVWSRTSPNEPRVTIIPDDEAREYTLQVGDGEPVHLGPHHKSRLVEALAEVYERGDEKRVTPLVTMYDELREQQVRTDLIDVFAGLPPFEATVEQTDNGWLIHDHLLLTWEGDFYHPDTTSRNRRGSIVEDGSTEPAYRVHLDDPTETFDRQINTGDRTYRMTNAELEFLAKALWGLTNAPKEV